MISANISFREATFSATALRKGIKNEPDEIQLRNMQVLAETVFEPLRKGLGDRPIHISSFFRSIELNALIGGSHTSQHTCINGAAMDLDNDNAGNPSNKEIFDWIRENLVFDQLIHEYGDNDNPAWVHVSYSDHNRQEVLRCVNGNYYKL